MRQKTSFLVGTFYQSNFTDIEKRIWLEKFEELLSKMCRKWNGLSFIVGDYNIDLNDPENSITSSYLDILHAFDLTHLINTPTRNSTTFIDHILATHLQESATLVSY